MADFDPPREDRVLLVEGQDDKHVVLHPWFPVSTFGRKSAPIGTESPTTRSSV